MKSGRHGRICSFVRANDPEFLFTRDLPMKLEPPDFPSIRRCGDRAPGFRRAPPQPRPRFRVLAEFAAAWSASTHRWVCIRHSSFRRKQAATTSCRHTLKS